MTRGTVTVVEGLIGAGKTCFTRELGEALAEQAPETKTLVFMEPDEQDQANPYLADYYEDPDRWAFTMQIHLLQARHKIHLDAQWFALNRGGHAIIDRPIFGDTSFARLQLKRGHLAEREYETYRSLYQSMTANILLPPFCVWVDTTPETSARRIAQRMLLREGRRCEEPISLEYLSQLRQEIQHMVAILGGVGVNVTHLDWNQDRNKAERKKEINKIAHHILNTHPPDLFLDLHRRTI